MAGVTTYAYDSENRLTKITYPDLTTSTFTYDGDGRRIKSAEGAAVTNYLYDGSLPIIERNTSNLTQVTYTHSLGYPGGIGGLISQTRSGVTSWYHYVHNGAANVSHLSDAAGTITQRYQFDAFGSITYQSGVTTNNYRFQTKELHDKSNLVYFGARWYNPTIGRWITPDPLGIIDGPNIYIYLNNNPLNDIDPWGLCEGAKEPDKEPWWKKPLEDYYRKQGIPSPYDDLKFPLPADPKPKVGGNLMTIGWGVAEIISGVAAIGRSVAISAVTGGVGTIASWGLVYTGVMAIGTGVADVILGIYGEPTTAELVADALNNDSIGTRLRQFTPEFMP